MIVSSGSLDEAREKNDPGHMQWLWDIADHSEVGLEGSGPTAESKSLAARLDQTEQFPIRMHHILRRQNSFGIRWV
jgi:hypothetical protein